jgi:hypothetical protein
MTVFLVLLGLPVFHAWAGDYEVAYAIDAHGKKAMGQSAECTYKEPCRLMLDALTSIAIVFYANHEFNLYVYGRDECCFFSGGERFVKINAERPFHRLSIFEGRPRRGNEVVVNKEIGELFLAFRNLTPAPRTGPAPFPPPPDRTRWWTCCGRPEPSPAAPAAKPTWPRTSPDHAVAENIHPESGHGPEKVHALSSHERI